MYYWIQEKFTKHGKYIKLEASCKKAKTIGLDEFSFYRTPPYYDIIQYMEMMWFILKIHQ